MLLANETLTSAGAPGEVEALFDNTGELVQLLLRDPSAMVCFYLAQLRRSLRERIHLPRQHPLNGPGKPTQSESTQYG